MRRQRIGEDQVGRAGREEEARAETGEVGDDGEDAVQGRVHDVQREAQEHEAELKRLGNAADKGAQRGRGDQADRSLPVLGGVHHRERRTRDAEHHAGEEAGHIHAEAPVNHFAGGADIAGDVARPVVGQIADADRVKPEDVVQRVVQAGGDQQAVEEGVETRADAAEADDPVAEGDQSVEDDRPDEDQNDRDKDRDHAGDDRHAALAAEESEPVRQFGALEFVVAGGADDRGQDADEGVAGGFLEGDVGRGVFFQRDDRADDGGVEQLGHHQVADEAGQRRGAVVVVRKADRRADGEQPGHVVNQGAARFNQDKADGVRKAGSGCVADAHRGRGQRIAQAHQDAADWQRGDRQHQCLAELLQKFHHIEYSS